MSKDVTGHAIGAYTRARRLSKSATALHLTTCPILDIALQYHFDSQQTFTRAFKRRFAQAPTLYRCSPEWSAFGIRPPLRLGELTVSGHKLVTPEDTPLTGVIQSYSCPLEQISDSRHETHYQFRHGFLGNTPTIPPVLYDLSETRPSRDGNDEQEVFYTTALAQDQADGYMLMGHLVMLQDGEYVIFTYEGLGADVQKFVLTIYGTCTPMLDLTRHRGQNIR